MKNNLYVYSALMLYTSICTAQLDTIEEENISELTTPLYIINGKDYSSLIIPMDDDSDARVDKYIDNFWYFLIDDLESVVNTTMSTILAQRRYELATGLITLTYDHSLIILKNAMLPFWNIYQQQKSIPISQSWQTEEGPSYFREAFLKLDKDNKAILEMAFINI